MERNIDNRLILLLLGDIMLGGDFIRFKQEQGVDYEYPFELCKGLFKDADIVFGNLECTLSNSGIPRETSLILYSPPESIEALKQLNFGVVSIGNNHINDYGEEGLMETIEILNDRKIPAFGAGKNLEEANREVIIERNGFKVSFLGYTTDEKHVNSVTAGSNTAGCVPYDFEKIAQDIDRIKTQSNIICISLHWGYQNYSYPAPEQIELAHQIIDAGAHIVIGHHPHIIQGFERYKHGIIFYSLGNFFFPNFYSKAGYFYKWREENNKFFIARSSVENGKIGRVEILGGFMNSDYQVVILEGKAQEKAIHYIEEISKEIKRGDYKDFWEDYSKKRSKELAKIELRRSFAGFRQRMKETGIRGCIRSISVRHIGYFVRRIGELLRL